MTLKLYNTLTRKKEEFKPIKEREAKIYSCGPTVYWFAHVGNLRSYIFSDILVRVLRYNNYKTNQIINVTDVGHLTSDADSGEDKLENAAKKEGKTAKEISHFYFDAFLNDFKKLNLTLPTKWAWATEHINEQIELIKKLEEKGYTYKTTDGIYFDTSKFSKYGQLSKKNLEELKAGKRVDMKEKINKTDFALWKFSKDEKRQQEWDSPWGVGFPGWHIECSAMSMKYLGETIDIHTGGEDHIPVHHENEIAQSEAATGKKFVNYWMHGAFLILPDGKMSKSKGTIKTIEELEKEDKIDPLSYKFFTYSAHYRKPLTWTFDALKLAQETYKKLKNITTQIEDDKKENQEYQNKFNNAINDDLNIPQALAVLWELLKDKNAIGKYQTIKKMDEVFGLKLLEKEEEQKVPEEIKDLAEQRQRARKEKDWAKSDKLRDELVEKGWKILDTKEGYTLEKV
jgi:cysteinyl-tRNA synthetase